MLILVLASLFSAFVRVSMVGFSEETAVESVWVPQGQVVCSQQVLLMLAVAGNLHSGNPGFRRWFEVFWRAAASSVKH